MDRRPGLSRRHLLGTLFRLLDERQVRYVVLHSYEALPESLPSDLDMALDPADAAKLAGVFHVLAETGYVPVQCMNYAVDGYYYVFTWFEQNSLHSLAVDFTLHHREGGRILMSGRELVDGRQRRADFWVPHAATEFGYLLGKKSLKGMLPARQAGRLGELAVALGRAEAERVAARWFGSRHSRDVVEFCQSGDVASRIRVLQRHFRRTLFRRDPLNAMRCRLTEFPRVLRRWFQPTGLSLAVLGPDGAGKSTLTRELVRQIQPAFRSTRLFHWRPFLLNKKIRGTVTNPHGQPPDPCLRSIARLLVHFADYHLGYWLRIRKALASAGLIAFDRYFHDMLADPRRYRYGGPMWLVRLMGRLIPKPHLVMVLDAPEEIVVSRKQEVAPDEVRRQRQVYRELAGLFEDVVVLDASEAPEEVAAKAAAWVADHLSARLAARAGVPGISGGGPDVAQQALNRLCGPSEGEGREHCFVAVPSRQRARLLLPFGNARAAAEGLNIYTPYIRRARFMMRLLEAAVGSGSKIWARHRLELPPGTMAELEQLVERVTGEPRPEFAISPGTANRFRKLAVQVMRPDGRILGLLKLPLAEEAAARVRHEAETLAALARYECLRSSIPRVLFAGEWRQSYVLFQSACRGRRGPVCFNGVHSEFLRTLAQAAPVYRRGAELVEMVAGRWTQAASQLDAGGASLGDKALLTAYRDLRDMMIPCGLSHGDFAPWNTRVRDGRLLVFDWESAQTDAPAWWDAMHFDFQVGCLLHRASGATAAGEQAPGWRGVYLLYLLHSMARCVEEQPDDASALEHRRSRLARLIAREPEGSEIQTAHVAGRY